MDNQASVVSFAPGRINLIGEHTDYNDGFVLPAAIDLGCSCRMRKNNKRLLNIWADDIDEFYSFDLKTKQRLETIPTWFKYFLGVFQEMSKQDEDLSGIDLDFSSTVPIGAGLSSSAAMTCSLAIGINELFSLGIPKKELMYIAQKAEHNYVGIQCGIMDQFASIYSKAAQVNLLNCNTMTFQPIPFELGAFEIVLVNSGVSHELASSEYNKRRKTCESVVEKAKVRNISIKSVSDLNLDTLNMLKPALTDIEYKRATHVIKENNRVLKAAAALQNSNILELGKLIYDSHSSLNEQYEVSCDELNFLVDATKELDYVLGSRMMGGGFGGCTLNIVAQEHQRLFRQKISSSFQKIFGTEPEIYDVKISEGAQILSESN
jgi:galactokinase